SDIVKEIINNFLTNQIILNWIVPIITGLIVFIIPAIIIKIFQVKKDRKKLNKQIIDLLIQ
ncbi:MAG: hypothetical protein RR659_01630, partial [Bacilli bacterium]